MTQVPKVIRLGGVREHRLPFRFCEASAAALEAAQTHVVVPEGRAETPGLKSMNNEPSNAETTTALAVGPGPRTEAEDPSPVSQATHSFSRVLARDERIGIKGAILLEGLAYKIKRSNNRRDGKHWYYCSLDELAERYPYLSRSGIDDVLKGLQDAGFVQVGNYNRRPGDQTRWYTIPDAALPEETVKGLLYFRVAATISTTSTNFGSVKLRLSTWTTAS